MNIFGTTRFVCILLSLTVLAIAPLSHAKKTAWTQISSFEVSKDGNLYVDPTSAVINPAGCSKDVHYGLGKSHAAFTRIYALVLSAYRKNAEILLDISKNQCVKSRPKIDGAAAR